MKVTFRVDASSQIGTGHAMRCYALAEALLEEGHEVQLAASALTDGIAARFRDLGVGVQAIIGAAGSPDDCGQTADVAASSAWTVLDGYDFSGAYRSTLSRASRLLWIDDQGSAKPTNADLVLNQNLYAAESLYPTTPRCRLLLGPAFALLRREFRLPPRRRNQTDGRPRVLITLGGADPRGYTAAAVRAARALDPDVDITAVIGAAHDADHAEVEARQLSAKVVRDARNMAELEAGADLVVAGCGTAVLELLRVQVPFVGVVVADNQARVGQALQEIGGMPTVDARETLDEDRLRDAMQVALRAGSTAPGRHPRPVANVDGWGASRVASALVQRTIELRSATADDALWLFELANDPAVRRASFHQDPIDWATHVGWLRHSLADATTRVWVAEANGTPMGTVRFTAANGAAVTSVSIVAAERRRGIGSWLIAEASERYLLETPSVDQIVAWVRPDNPASTKAFIAAGYRERRAPTASPAPGALRFVLEREPAS